MATTRSGARPVKRRSTPSAILSDCPAALAVVPKRDHACAPHSAYSHATPAVLSEGLRAPREFTRRSIHVTDHDPAEPRPRFLGRDAATQARSHGRGGSRASTA